MRLFKTIIISVLSLSAIYILFVIWRINAIAATETYPPDTYLQSVKIKKALVIVAHDDDAIGSSGTIAMLAQQGWDIHMVCFYSSAWRPADNPSEKKRLNKWLPFNT